MEKCYSKHYRQLSFKYFVKSLLILKLFSKVSLIQTTISVGTLKHECVNEDICGRRCRRRSSASANYRVHADIVHRTLKALSAHISLRR